jgi:hypothetical protein
MATLRVSSSLPVSFKTVQLFRVKKFSWLLLSAALVLSFGLGIQSCRKINEATALGGNLVPAVDNINTFADTLDVTIKNEDWRDSTQLYSNDELALGYIGNDPEFGNTLGNIYFNFSPSNFQQYPFYNKDSVIVNNGNRFDSAVLSLAVTNLYGDSSQQQRVRVFEIDPNAGFTDSVYYTTRAQDFATTGPELGNRLYTPRSISDSVRFIRGRDTGYTVNTLRINLAGASAFVNRLVNADTNIVYRNYGLFYSNFAGLALKSDAIGNGLSYFNLADSARTKLTVYYRVKRNGVIDTTFATFYHGLFGAGFQSVGGAAVKPRGSQANTIRRRVNGIGGNWLTYLNSGLQDKVYVQSDPGSQTIITIPGLANYGNRVVHRAELIATRLHTAEEGKFPPPPYLYLTRTTNGLDTMQVLDDSLSASLSTGALNATIFGGNLLSDDTYRFNLTRHVQNIVTSGGLNTKLKLFAPFRYSVKDTRFPGAFRTFAVLPRIAYGRVVLAGPTNANPQVRMRVRVIYSRI